MANAGVSFIDPFSLGNGQLMDLMRNTLQGYAWDGQIERLRKYHNYMFNTFLDKSSTDYGELLNIL